MTLAEILEIAEAYKNLGWAVQEQLQHANGGEVDNLNGNAKVLIVDWLELVKSTSEEDADDSYDDAVQLMDALTENFDDDYGFDSGSLEDAEAFGRETGECGICGRTLVGIGKERGICGSCHEDVTDHQEVYA